MHRFKWINKSGMSISSLRLSTIIAFEIIFNCVFGQQTHFYACFIEDDEQDTAIKLFIVFTYYILSTSK